MSTPTLNFLMAVSEGLAWAMQVSILVPMAVVWRRRRQFPPPVKLLSWYVYFSLLCSIGARIAEVNLLPNWPMLAAFNFGKIALFGGVYYLVLRQWLVRRLVLASAVLTVAFGIYAMLWLDMRFVVTYARVLQCALLAAFALAYLEQLSREPPLGQLNHNPLFLLSVGQLLYSAGSVMYFSIGFVKLEPIYNKIYFGIPAALGLVFNILLTMAFLRAQPEAALHRTGTLASA
ncbi:hypothetical protein GCM10023185_45800 [Hymenobacter saemangeumensis]|uniref:Uncharacterized protein n=1 Tax=Hymenobacter saemangeumensis TaxID=1084522 RepID=A0ABP8ISZ8_9BACT